MPMTKCGGCGKFISPADAARCTKCNEHYHRVCVALTGRGALPSFWQCPECRKNVRRDNKSETPVRSSQAEVQAAAAPLISAESPVLRSTISEESADEGQDIGLGEPAVCARETGVAIDDIVHEQQIDVASQLQAIMGELRNLRIEVLELRKEVRSSGDACNVRMDSIEARLQVLEERHADVPVTATAVEGVVEQLKRDLNERDQELGQRLGDSEFARIPSREPSSCCKSHRHQARCPTR
ncbi:hypothetical protein HF086_005350 [Spodoptera exigua]|uniref:Zinc finger PHD-type domain-containing protein n=1 Tax=Spodoptera exigua TaxID=7107 RepID=A0A922SL50_SPOEX|nr:hypothetical protein HF086_005350 [Spodoptera exigua]